MTLKEILAERERVKCPTQSADTIDFSAEECVVPLSTILDNPFYSLFDGCEDY